LKFPDDFSSIYWRYSLQQVDYYDFESSYNPTPAYDLRTRGFPLLESAMRVSFVRDNRDSRMFATSGSRNSYSIEAAGHIFGGDIEYQLQEIRSDWYFKLTEYLTFVAKARFSFLSNWGGDLSDVPYSERFFPGGVSYDGQIRGYDDRSISPTDSTFDYDSTLTPDPGGNIPLTGKSTFLAGGSALSIYTLEMRVPIMKDQLYTSLFFDAGNAWLNLDDMSIDDLYKSTGVGVRFVIPMLGVLGFDMAYGYDRPDEPDWKFHFQIGPEQ
jgi:outer membrane protein insertion porin family